MAAFIEQSFRDIEALYASGTGEGWEGERLQLSRGPLGLRIQVAALPNMRIHWYWTQASMHARESLCEPGLFLTFVLKASGDLSLFGRPFGPDQLLAYTPGGEVDGVLPAGVESVGFFLSPVLQRRLGLPDRLPICSHLDQAVAHRVVMRARRILDICETTPFPDPTQMYMAEERLSLDIARLIRPAAEPFSTVNRNAAALKRALDLLRETAAEDLPTVAEMAAVAGVSERTLYRLFHGIFGIGPYEYALRLRMGLFRKALARFQDMGSERGSVTRAASEAGFSHFGRFSQQYRELFGETPRQTLLRWRRGGLESETLRYSFIPLSAPTLSEVSVVAHD